MTLVVQSEQTIGVPVSVMKRMLESVERAEAAAKRAVSISTQARNAFEEETKRLSEV